MRTKYEGYDRQYYRAHRERLIAYSRNWARTHREKARAIAQRHYRKVRLEIIRHYSPEVKCVRCGFSDLRALSIDHINGEGALFRRMVTGEMRVYQWIKRNNFPEGIQILCMNCQFIKQHENNEHQKREHGPAIIAQLGSSHVEAGAT